MRSLLILAVAVVIGNTAFAQQQQKKNFNTLTTSLTAGSSRGSVAVAYNYHWLLGKKKKFEVALGVRNTLQFGTKQEYLTAPAKLARTNTIPFLIVFAGLNEANIDTLVVQRPLVNSLNAMIQLGYHFSPKFSAGFNIDLLGFTVGRKSAAILTSNGVTTTEPESKPANFNALLTGDLDYGSLNSEFLLQYKINDKWGIRGVYQFVFSEYKTQNISQIAPDGTVVKRFRQKANNLGIAISYHF
jgi:hypothetical protein